MSRRQRVDSTPLRVYIGGCLFAVRPDVGFALNAASAPFNWALGLDAPWLSASATDGALVSNGAAALVTVSLNSAATALGPGTYTNTVWLTNLADHVVQTRQYTLVISNITVTPIVTWTNPSAIVYGTALGSGQFNATASVPGIFTYLPPGGSAS